MVGRPYLCNGSVIMWCEVDQGEVDDGSERLDTRSVPFRLTLLDSFLGLRSGLRTRSPSVLLLYQLPRSFCLLLQPILFSLTLRLESSSHGWGDDFPLQFLQIANALGLDLFLELVAVLLLKLFSFSLDYLSGIYPFIDFCLDIESPGSRR